MADKRRQSSSSQSRPRPVREHSSGESSRSRSPSESFRRAASIARLGSPVRSLQGSPSIRQVPPQQLIATEPSQSHTPLAGPGPQSSLPGPGESALANALRESFGRGSPPRFSTPPAQPPSPAATAAAADSRPLINSNYGSFDHRSVGSPRPYEDPEIIRRHLVGPSKGSSSNISGQYGSPRHTSGLGSGAGISAEEEEEFNSLRLQGGDIHRQVYRWTEQQEAEASGQRTRSKSFHEPRPTPQELVLNINSIKQPGGFRRNFLRRAVASPSPGPSNYGSRRIQQPPQQPQIFTSNFLEFLTLYGHFAGEDLEEDDEALGPDEYFSSDVSVFEGAAGAGEGGEEGEGEEAPLLKPHMKKRHRREKVAGTGSPSGAALLLLKSFVGTGVLFLPRAFLNGGFLFSNLVLLFVAAISYYCMVLLVQTRLKVPHSFGDMGAILVHPWLRNAINFSLVISQIGFSSAYMVFVSENLQAFVLAVSNCTKHIKVGYLIIIQACIFFPFSLYRNINNIQKMALVADIFIVLGLGYLYYYDILTLARQHGVADIKMFNPKDWTVFIGTAIFTFEGIGLVIPIQTGMRDPTKFPQVLAAVMVIITVIFTSMGALSYAAYGSKTQTVVILNMPQDNKMVNGVQFIYSLAILLSTPLQIYPAIEITSQQLFSRTGRYNPWVKWKKNFFRFFIVTLVAVIAYAGSDDLDKFVSLVGSFACVPLVYIYPPWLHYYGLARSSWMKITDVLLCIFGLAVMVYTTVLTVNSWATGDDSKPPGYCDTIRG